MAESARIWVPVPGWWYPIWVTFDADGQARDPLEDAVFGLVRAGLCTTRDLALALRVGAGLVESAAGQLLATGVLERDGDQLKAVTDRPAHERLAAQRGYLAWDPAAGRPLLQLWLDVETPEIGQAPTGWDLAPWEPPDELSAPTDREVSEALRLLPDAGDLRVFRPMGSGMVEIDGARVQRLRRRGSRNRRLAPIWVPVEQRVPGPVVWRPALVPTRDIETELAPGGWAGLHDVSAPVARALLDAGRAACLMNLAPGVLKEAGFTSVEDLRGAARAMAARELGDLEGWEKAKKAAEDAFVMERLGEAAGGDWRQRATGWASLFDMITHQLVRQLLPGSPASWPRPDADEDQQNQRLLGALWPEVRGVLRKPDGMEAVRKRILGDADTIGDRLQWLGGSIATLPKVRSAFGKVIADEPELFDHLDRARRERNAIVHPRERADAVLVAGFRARVLQVCRALIRVRAS